MYILVMVSIHGLIWKIISFRNRAYNYMTDEVYENYFGYPFI